MKFIHTADLQIGARFARFGEKADILRAARLSNLKRILEIAQDQRVDAVLIAGDMFENNRIANSSVEEAFAILAAYPDIPVVILPGNHDPLDGPGCIWMREPFATPPPHVTVCRTRETIELAGAAILPVPITQKVSVRDPSLPMLELSASLPRDRIKIGLTHGSLAIEGKHQPNDHPVALNAASRAGLDYLAVGHWHKPQVYDDNRLAMPGTPEPDDFSQDSGSVALVEISDQGRQPAITHIDSATFVWRQVTLDLLNQEPTPQLVSGAVSGINASPESTVLRIELTGPLSPEQRAVLTSSIAEATGRYAVVQVDDRTSTVLSPALWQACLQQHPLLAQIVADVDRAHLFNTGHAPTIENTDLAGMTLDEFQSLCAGLKIEPGQLQAGAFETMMALLAAEVASSIQKAIPEL